MTTFIDARELDTAAVRDIVVQAGCEWPADDSRESRLFRFRVRRIANEAFLRGMQAMARANAQIAAALDDLDAEETA